MKVEIEVLKQMLKDKDISLPYSEKSSEIERMRLLKLLERKSITGQYYDERVSEIDSQTLDDKTMKMFRDAVCSCIE